MIAATDSLNVRLHGDTPSTAQLWLPSIIAIVVVVLGGMIQWRIASRQWKEQREALDRQLEAQRELTEKQIEASLRGAARLRWIDGVRRLTGDALASSSRVVATLTIVEGLRRSTRAHPENQSFREELKEYHRVLLRRQLGLQRLTTHLRLFLDPREEIQKALSEASVKLEIKTATLSAFRMDEDLPADFAGTIGTLNGELQHAAIALIRHYSQGMQSNP